MKFRSKIDFNRYLSLGLVLALFIWCLYDVIVSFSIFNCLMLALWSYATYNSLGNMFGTYYTLLDNELVITSNRKEIRLDYAHLAIIYDTSNIESYSYFALSKDTLGLIYNSHIMLISPKDKDGFVNNLVKYINASC